MGQSTFSVAEKQAILDYVFEEIAKKRFLSGICGKDKVELEGRSVVVPSHSSVVRWCDENPQWRRAYERAREVASAAFLEETIAIADDTTRDAYIEIGKDGEPFAKWDGDNVRRAALKVNARERFAQLMAPHLYGNRLDVTSGGQPLPPPISLNDNRLQALLLVAQERKASGQALINVTPSPEEDDDPSLDDIMA